MAAYANGVYVMCPAIGGRCVYTREEEFGAGVACVFGSCEHGAESTEIFCDLSEIAFAFVEGVRAAAKDAGAPAVE